MPPLRYRHTSSACVDRQVIKGYELCKVEFPGGCSDHEEPQAAAAEYGQSTFGDDWLPIGDHGGSCNNGYCIDAHIDLGHQAFNDCSAGTDVAQYLQGTCGVYYDSSVANSDSYCDSMYGTVFICCSPASQDDDPMGMYCVNGGSSFEYEDAAERSVAGTLSLDRRLMAQPAESTCPQKNVGHHNQHFEI